MGKFGTEFTKHYFEEFARIVLNDLLNLNLIHRTSKHKEDRPDLISDDEKIGVEVTRAISGYEGKHTKLFQQKYPKGNRVKIIQEEAKRLGVEKDLYISHGVISLKISDNITSDYVKNLIDAINKKLKLLNQEAFNRYPQNCLYLQASLISDYYIEEVLNNFSSYVDHYEINFDIIYIFTVDYLYIFKDSAYYKIELTEQFIKSCKDRALEYSKSHK